MNVTYVWDDERQCEREVVVCEHRALRVRYIAFGQIVGTCVVCGEDVSKPDDMRCWDGHKEDV